MDCSPPGFSVHGIFLARILEWVAISYSRASSQSRDWTWVSCWAGRCFITQLPGKCTVHGSFNPWMQNLQVQRANSTWAPFLMIFHPWFKSSSVHSGSSGMVGISGASLPTRSPDIRDRILSKLLCSHPCLWSHLQKCTSVGVTNTAAALACASAPPGCAMGTTTAGTGLMKPTVLVSISWPPWAALNLFI